MTQIKITVREATKGHINIERESVESTQATPFEKTIAEAILFAADRRIKEIMSAAKAGGAKVSKEVRHG